MKTVKNDDTFEKKLLRLEEISSLLESGDVGLEESIKLYEEGIGLSKVCLSALKSAELRITELKKQMEDDTADNEF